METNTTKSPWAGANFNVRVGDRYLGKMTTGQPLGLVAGPFRYPFTESEAQRLATEWNGTVEPKDATR